MKAHRHTNRLIDETSPYLLQHAHNPVDWVPWGDEAFDQARNEKKPILLSIGYSACHWCHVMEAESFENEAIAEIMNLSFVNIKVDREERPDLDQIYQNAVQFFIKRGGGWPLTMFLTPDKIPFFGGTYFPPEDRYQLPGFPRILEMVSQTYREKQEDIAKTVEGVKDALRRISDSRTGGKGKSISPDLVGRASEALVRVFDPQNGGFGGAPKFPSTPALTLLLRHHHASGDDTSLQRVTYTLGRMAWGGIYDQLGGGFHRYATDEHWLVPHFEKMLYDNAQLAPLYFQTYQATGHEFYRKIGEEILEYVMREMTDPSGGFYSTQDADSEGREGQYFVWTPEEINKTLGEEGGSLFCQYYNVTSDGNFEGKNILHRTQAITDLSKKVAKKVGKSSESVEQALEQSIAVSRHKLLLERDKRVKPFRDEKILTSWNGLMISAFVEGYLVTREGHYLSAARKSADFILKNLTRSGRLLRVWKAGAGKLDAYLEDYTFFINALLDLHEATFETVYLEQAKRLTSRLIDHFWDGAGAGFFYTGKEHEPLITREKPFSDQSIPSGNAVAARVLLRLSHLTGDPDYFGLGEKTLQSFSRDMEENVFSTGNMITVADFYLSRPKEILIVGKRNSPETEKLLSKIYRLYLPNKVLLLTDPNDTETSPFPGIAAQRSSIKREKAEFDGEPTVYICHHFTCSLPLKDWETIRKTLLHP